MGLRKGHCRPWIELLRMLPNFAKLIYIIKYHVSLLIQRFGHQGGCSAHPNRHCPFVFFFHRPSHFVVILFLLSFTSHSLDVSCLNWDAITWILKLGLAYLVSCYFLLVTLFMYINLTDIFCISRAFYK